MLGVDWGGVEAGMCMAVNSRDLDVSIVTCVYVCMDQRGA